MLYNDITARKQSAHETLRSRVALLSGIAYLDTAPGQGTQIQVRLSLSGPPPSAA